MIYLLFLHLSKTLSLEVQMDKYVFISFPFAIHLFQSLISFNCSTKKPYKNITSIILYQLAEKRKIYSQFLLKLEQIIFRKVSLGKLPHLKGFSHQSKEKEILLSRIWQHIPSSSSSQISSGGATSAVVWVSVWAHTPNQPLLTYSCERPTVMVEHSLTRSRVCSWDTRVAWPQVSPARCGGWCPQVMPGGGKPGHARRERWLGRAPTCSVWHIPQGIPTKGRRVRFSPESI